ncbi:MAG: translation elongation factor Ts [Leptolyngbyaceae cyanobacterium RU_5_1]|nr:translation elongation factor Ts [Leptolyngbyaceae cyanobacterium RU_5_1]
MAEISAKLVKELREKTGAGMMDCKKALQETEGDIEKAIEWLRKKGIASAGKKEGKVAAEGLVDSYIHIGGRIGVLVEVNCQTDFVARNEAFKTLVSNIAKQIAASQNVEYVKVGDIPAEIAEKEKSIEMGKDDLAGKPDNIKEKIVQGRIEKRLKEMCLLDQAYIKDPNITVEELVKQHIAQLGENIQVRRFVRFNLGEGIEKQESDFAAEVAAQMGTAAPPKPEEAAQDAEDKQEDVEVPDQTEAKQEEPVQEAEAEQQVSEVEVKEVEVKEDKKSSKKSGKKGKK